MKRFFLYLPLLVLAGCVYGPKLKNFDAAYSPAGVTSTILLMGQSLELKGELLAVERDALVLAVPGRIVRISLGVIRRASFEDAPHLGFSLNRRPRTAALRELSLLSRFPQGITDDVQGQLLSAYGRDEIESLP